MEQEIWKPVEGFENLYAVSNLGRIKSLWFGREKILKPHKVKGYLQVGLCRNGKIKQFYVHRLVAEAFLPNPLGLPEVNHKDENKSNNVVSDVVSNLEWCSHKYNSNFGTRNERVASALTNHPAKSKTVEASKYPDFREIELRFASTWEADRNNYKQGAVSACCRGCFHREGNNKYKNLYWRYAV